MSVTRLGVSLLNVVATIERPASHQGTERPEAKNSEVLLPDLLPKKRAGAKQTPTARRAMIQSSALRCIGWSCGSVKVKRGLGALSRGAYLLLQRTDSDLGGRNLAHGL